MKMSPQKYQALLREKRAVPMSAPAAHSDIKAPTPPPPPPPPPSLAEELPADARERLETLPDGVLIERATLLGIYQEGMGRSMLLDVLIEAGATG